MEQNPVSNENGASTDAYSFAHVMRDALQNEIVLALVPALRRFFQFSLGKLLPDAFSVKLDELQDTELLRRAFVVKGARISNLALQQSQILRVNRELQTGVRRMRCRINGAVGIVSAFVDKERTLKLNLAAEAATVALASLVGFITIEKVVGQHIRQDVPAKGTPGVK